MTARSRAMQPIRGTVLRLLCPLGILLFQPGDALGQLSEPCELACAAALGVTSAVFATGASAAVGRLNGGYTTAREGVTVWASGFTVAAVSGMALSGDGHRQRRVVYAAGIGTVAGSLAGAVIESLFPDGTGATSLAAALVGASVGAVVGGVIGAATYERPADPGGGSGAALRSPSLVIRIGL